LENTQLENNGKWDTLWQQSHPKSEVDDLALFEKVARHSASNDDAYCSSNKHDEGKRK